MKKLIKISKRAYFEVKLGNSFENLRRGVNFAKLSTSREQCELMHAN